jgi:hypothetical protein
VIDLRKPLENIPGLLLLAVLVLFGAIVGISLALLFSWVEMKDSLANFLGGIVGAALGSALAVMGSLFLYERKKREDLVPDANELRVGLAEIMTLLEDLVRLIRGQTPAGDGIVHTDRIFEVSVFLGNASVALSRAATLPRPVFENVRVLKSELVRSVDAARAFAATPMDIPRVEALAPLLAATKLIEAVQRQLEPIK